MFHKTYAGLYMFENAVTLYLTLPMPVSFLKHQSVDEVTEENVHLTHSIDDLQAEVNA